MGLAQAAAVETVLAVRGLRVTIGGRTVVDGVDLEIGAPLDG